MIRVGIGGWSFEPWKDNFYPKGLAATKELEYASQRLNVIEINATFYKTQSATSFKKWAAATPDNFMFTVKASRAATQRRDLREAAESVEWFLNSGLTEMGDKLGPIFWQMAPYKKFDAEEMKAYFALLPEKHGKRPLRHAIEVRHESFLDPKFRQMATDRNIAVIHVDADKRPDFMKPTADFVYARLERTLTDEPTGYAKKDLAKWAETAKQWEKTGDTFVFFISGAKERNPAAAMAMIELLKK
jgi:uncharacterized protein YecE (DUF72 family)